MSIDGGLGVFGTILADPPWNYTSNVTNPERVRNIAGAARPGGLSGARRETIYKQLPLRDIKALPVGELSASNSHLYLWTPNFVLPQALEVMTAWGFSYRSIVIWVKTDKSGNPSRQALGSYFRNATELCLFGIRGRGNARPANHGRHNVIQAPRTEHSRKPDELHGLIEHVSPGPYLELFARRQRRGWTVWGDQLPDLAVLV